MNNFCRHPQVVGVDGAVIEEGLIWRLVIRRTYFEPSVHWF